MNENKLRAALSSKEDFPLELAPGDLCISVDFPASAPSPVPSRQLLH